MQCWKLATTYKFTAPLWTVAGC